MPPPGAARTSSTKWHDRQFMERPLNGASLVIGAPNVSTESTTGSPAFGSFKLPPASRKALKVCANLVSIKRRSPTACSAPGVPVAWAVGGGPGELLPEQPVTAIDVTSTSMKVDTTRLGPASLMVTPSVN